MKWRRTLVPVVAALAALSALGAAVARAQNTQGPIAPNPGGTIQTPPGGAIRVRVALVNAPVSVRDASNELVLDLRKENFHVFDNGVEQTIDAFDVGGQAISAVLLFEASSRIAALLPAVQKSAIVFTQTVVGPSGQAAVLSSDERVQHLLPLTDDPDKLEKTIATLNPGTGGAHFTD